MNEFELIKKYFDLHRISRSDVVLGIGDDAALVNVPPGEALAISTDTLVSGVHFPDETAAVDIGYKALAVNLSDLAAMGATPAWMMLSVTLPQADHAWLNAFSDGLFQLADLFNVQLIGGDTTRGPLSMTISVYGFVPPQQALCRQGARAGDKIYVSGTLGDAGLGLQVVQGQWSLSEAAKRFVMLRLNRPTPRVALGVALRGMATSAIDVSDGLVADLQHILDGSQVGAAISADDLPLSLAMRNHVPLDQAKALALSAGDDYELCFTVSPHCEPQLLDLKKQFSFPITCIGTITEKQGVAISGLIAPLQQHGYGHF